MNTRLRWVAVWLACSSASGAARAQATSRDVLPLRRVRLYEAGVGYFERSGAVVHSAQLPVPRGHIDDALKSLVVLDETGTAEVAGVEFDQVVSVARGRALAGLPTTDDDAVDFDTYLESLTGVRVEIRTEHATTTGKLMEVVPPERSALERCLPPPPDNAQTKASTCVGRKVTSLLLLNDRGALERFAAVDLLSVRPLDPAVTQRLREALGSERGANHSAHPLQIKLTKGHELTLGYVAEAPLWRASYRLVVTKNEALLQGWALVHNDTEEPWQGIQLELVNGQPDSFLFPLAAPRYANRRLVTPEEHLPSVPQLLHQNADDDWDGNSRVTYRTGLGGVGGVGAGGRGQGIAYYGALDDSRIQESSLLSIGNLAAQPVAAGDGVGALFRYAMPSPVHLGAGKSALLPFLREGVEARRIVFFPAPAKAGRSSLLLTNTSSQTLPAGTIALFEGGGFAGESALERTEPNQKRTVQFGLDLDVELRRNGDERVTDETRLLRFSTTAPVEHYVRRVRNAVSVENRGVASRTVHWAVTGFRNARIEGGDGVFSDDETGASHAVFEVPGAQTKKYSVTVEEGLARRHRFVQLTSRTLERLVRETALPEWQRALVREARTHLLRHEALLRKRGELTREAKRLAQRSARLVSTLTAVRLVDLERGRNLAKILVSLERTRTELEEQVAGLDPYPPFRSAKRVLSKLNGARGPQTPPVIESRRVPPPAGPVRDPGRGEAVAASPSSR